MRTFILASVLVIAGCASLDRLDEPDPVTGVTPAESIKAETEAFSAPLPPPFNWVVPSVVGLGLVVLTAIGNIGKKDDEPVPPVPPT
ncbi:MAG: hypothetical protein ACW99U_17770 [Candidatus Thorarchaeota archaeon]